MTTAGGTGRGVAILLDSSPRSWGTREEFHFRLCRTLRSRGFHPVLVHSEELPSELKERLASAGAELATLNHHHGSYLTQLGTLVSHHRIELAHVRFFDYFSVVPWLIRLRGVRHIVFTDANGGEWEPKRLTRHLVRLRARLACWPITRVIAISTFIRDRLVSLGVGSDRIVVIHNGIDPHRFAPDSEARSRFAAQHGIQSDELVVSTVGSLLPIKHVDVVLEACATLVARGIRVRLFVAGDGPLRQALEQRGEELCLGERVRWLGHVGDPTMLLQSTDVFVLASVGEAFGNVLAEAMACGVPIVASRSGGIREVVQDNDTGYLVTPRSPAAFADAIERLAMDKDLRLSMGTRAITRARHDFSVDRAVEETIGVYTSILIQPRR
jgi:glycosyltransferase involved in cell wall biosynthesis